MFSCWYVIFNILLGLFVVCLPTTVIQVWTICLRNLINHYCDVIMSPTASQITSLMIVYSIVYSGTDIRKHQNSTSLAFVRGIHRRPVNSPHEWPVTRKMFPFDDVIMCIGPGRCGNNFRSVSYDKSMLVQAMAWCHQSANHYLSQWWAGFMSSHSITRPQWGNPYNCVEFTVKSLIQDAPNPQT